VIELESIGLRVTIQDAGRLRYLRAGLPTAGPADRVAHAAANALVGNDPGSAAIEIVGLPLAVRALRALLLAATGPEVRLHARAPIPGWTCAFVRAGESIRVEGNARYAYLAVGGAIDVPAMLGSRAAYVPAGIGPAPLRPGDTVPTGTATTDLRLAGRRFAALPAYGSGVARVILGPHADRADVAAFLAGRYRVDERSDRMGVRLVGPQVATRGGELLTCGMVEGAVQIPAGGLPIVLLADHQTTGGYPVVGTVIAADLPIVAQAHVGSTLRFAATTRAEAVDALQRVRRALALEDRSLEIA
jgi:biotin-dependent carboxylase-like uncharacterized protein